VKRPQSVLLPLAVLAIALSANRPGVAVVFLSGDGNIVDHLLGANIDPGNQQFLKNALQGGTKVAVLRNTFAGCCETFDENISAFYNTLPGVTATTIIGTVNAAGLSGVNLFLSAIPDDSFTGSEISAMNGLLSNGGSIFFLGENSNFPTQNGFINSALAGLGIGMSIGADTNESGSATVNGAQISATSAFTSGVTTFTYAAPSQVSGGVPLIYNVNHLPIIEVNVDRSVPEPSNIVLALLLSGLGYLRRRPHGGNNRTYI
jgi:hypothetical protein